MEDPTVWAGIWLAVAALFGIGEISSPGSFFLAPFAAGAVAASVVSFIGAPILIGWLVFILGSLGTFFLLRPLAKKLEVDTPNAPGIGANRLIGHEGVVSADIPAGVAGTGVVRLGGEQWNAEGRDGMGVATGTSIRVVEVKGTRVVVEPSTDTGLDSIQ